MAKGFLKYMLLKEISMNESTGYQLIKKVAEIIGSRPSTGSIYPQLKRMENNGWIISRPKSGKKYYKITNSGRKKIKEFDEIKMDQMVKIHQSIAMANDTFKDTGYTAVLSNPEIYDILEPLIVEVDRVIKKEVKSEKITRIINKATQDLRKVK